MQKCPPFLPADRFLPVKASESGETKNHPSPSSQSRSRSSRLEGVVCDGSQNDCFQKTQGRNGR